MELQNRTYNRDHLARLIELGEECRDFNRRVQRLEEKVKRLPDLRKAVDAVEKKLSAITTNDSLDLDELEKALDSLLRETGEAKKKICDSHLRGYELAPESLTADKLQAICMNGNNKLQGLRASILKLYT